MDSTGRMERSVAPRSTAASASVKARHGNASPGTPRGARWPRLQRPCRRRGCKRILASAMDILRAAAGLIGVDSPAGGGGSKAGRGKNARGCYSSRARGGGDKVGPAAVVGRTPAAGARLGDLRTQWLAQLWGGCGA